MSFQVKNENKTSLSPAFPLNFKDQYSDKIFEYLNNIWFSKLPRIEYEYQYSFEHWSKGCEENSILYFHAERKLFTMFSVHILLYKDYRNIWYLVTTIRVLKYYLKITNGPNI